MKQLLTLSVCLFLVQTISSAQSFVSKKNTWITQKWSWDFFNNQEVVSDWIYILDEEVMENGQAYLLVSSSTLDSIDFHSNVYHGFRESLDNKILDIDDEIVYDFDLELGDVISYVEGYNLTVDSVEMITLLDGSEVRKFHLVDDNLPNPFRYYLVEGVGFSRYPLRPHSYLITDNSESLKCFYRNNRLVYQHDEDYVCQETLTSTKEPLLAGISFSLDDGRISVEGIDAMGLSIAVYSVTGQLLQKAELSSGAFELDSGLPSGMLITQLTKSGEVLHTQTLFIP